MKQVELDALGLLCPLPVLKARKKLQELAPGDQLDLLSDDPAAVVDVPHFCAETGHQLVDMTEIPQGMRFTIQKSG